MVGWGPVSWWGRRPHLRPLFRYRRKLLHWSPAVVHFNLPKVKVHDSWGPLEGLLVFAGFAGLRRLRFLGFRLR